MFYQPVSVYDFVDAFMQIRPLNFSREALCALYEELGGDDDDEIKELDVIAICCAFTEYDSIEEAAEAYNNTPAEMEGWGVIKSRKGSVIVADH